MSTFTEALHRRRSAGTAAGGQFDHKPREESAVALAGPRANLDWLRRSTLASLKAGTLTRDQAVSALSKGVDEVLAFRYLTWDDVRRHYSPGRYLPAPAARALADAPYLDHAAREQILDDPRAALGAAERSPIIHEVLTSPRTTARAVRRCWNARGDDPDLLGSFIASGALTPSQLRQAEHRWTEHMGTTDMQTVFDGMMRRLHASPSRSGKPVPGGVLAVVARIQARMCQRSSLSS